MFTESVYHLVFRGKAKLRKLALQEEHVPIHEVRELQLKKLRALVRHAYEHIPFHRKRFEAIGLKPEHIRSLKDIKKLPICTKEDLAANKDAFDPELIHRGSKRKTSGSSGNPLEFYVDLGARNEERKGLFRLHHAIGIRFGDKIVRMRSSDIPRDGMKGWFQKEFGNTKHISTKEMTKASMPTYIDFILKHKPKMIESFPHHILALAEYMDNFAITLDVPVIHLVGGNASEVNRKRLERLFHARIYNDYGSSECMRVAYQCEHFSGYHIEHGRYFIEVLKKNKDCKKGEVGEIVITDLHNYVMPFIRYRIKDLAEVGGTCDCGRTSPLLSKIIGRIRQTIFLPNGKLLDPNSLNKRILNYSDRISGFQAILTRKEELTINVISKGLSKTDEQKLKDEISTYIQDAAPVKIKRVKSIKKYGAEKKDMSTLMQIPPEWLR